MADNFDHLPDDRLLGLYDAIGAESCRDILTDAAQERLVNALYRRERDAARTRAAMVSPPPPNHPEHMTATMAYMMRERSVPPFEGSYYRVTYTPTQVEFWQDGPDGYVDRLKKETPPWASGVGSAAAIAYTILMHRHSAVADKWGRFMNEVLPLYLERDRCRIIPLDAVDSWIANHSPSFDQPKESNTMNESTLIFLLDDKSVIACTGTYEKDGEASPSYRAPREFFKTRDPSVKPGDLYITTSGTRHGYTVIKIDEVGVSFDIETKEPFRWLGQRIDPAPIEAMQAFEKKALEIVRQAERDDKRKKLQEKVLGSSEAVAKLAGEMPVLAVTDQTKS